MKTIYLCIITAAILMTSSCKKNGDNSKANSISSIKYGTSFGECLGYCAHNMTIQKDSIFFSKSGWNMQDVLPDESAKENISPEYWNALLEKIDFEAFIELDDVIGCPDCADGGAGWIEITKNNQSHRVTFDLQMKPDTLKPILPFLNAYLKAYELDEITEIDFNNRVLINQEATLRIVEQGKCKTEKLVEIIQAGKTVQFHTPYIYLEQVIDGSKYKMNIVLWDDSTTISKDMIDVMEDYKVRKADVFIISAQ